MKTHLAALIGCLLVSGSVLAFTIQQPVQIPRTWDPEKLKDFELPLPQAGVSVEHISPEYYYGLKERVIHRTYPLYHPDFEPAGYLDSLRALGPGSAFDPDTIDTQEEWIRAGEMVFDAPVLFLPPVGAFGARGLAALGAKPDVNGVYPWGRYVVMPNGRIALGAAACATCHTRVMPDGTVIKGAQGNFPFDRLMAEFTAGLEPPDQAGFVSALVREQFGAPWIEHLSQTMLDTLSPARHIQLRRAIPPGVLTRQGTHLLYPVHVPDLRGIRHRRFFDATGIMQQRSIGDLMRYAAFNAFVDHLNRYNDFVPSLGHHPGAYPPPDSVQSFFNGPFERYSDAQLFALANYLYSLEPLPSPHRYDAETLALGERVFIEEGCVTCHPPPDFTNNELTPAAGFEPPEEHFERYPIFDASVETDPGLTMLTRRGTGYYKVPSLRGLWYRDKFLHDGSLATLDELLDPARLRADFAPGGFAGADTPRRAVPGHAFGLELPPAEKQALIAYLLTL